MCGRYIYYSSDEILKQYSVEHSKDLQLALEMPDAQAMDLWLKPIELSQSLLDDILSPAPDDSLNIVRVSTEVNNTRNNSRELIYPLEDS